MNKKILIMSLQIINLFSVINFLKNQKSLLIFSGASLLLGYYIAPTSNIISEAEENKKIITKKNIKKLKKK